MSHHSICMNAIQFYIIISSSHIFYNITFDHRKIHVLMSKFWRKAYPGLGLCMGLCMLLHLPAHQKRKAFWLFIAEIWGMCVMNASHPKAPHLCLCAWLSLIEGVSSVSCISCTLWTEKSSSQGISLTHKNWLLAGQPHSPLGLQITVSLVYMRILKLWGI